MDGHDLSFLLTEVKSVQNCEIYKSYGLHFIPKNLVRPTQILGCSFFLFQTPLDTYWVVLFSVPLICPHYHWHSLSFSFLHTSLSWFVIERRVTGLLGLLPSLTGAMCPFLMIGTVASGWPGVWGCTMVWPCPVEEASLEPSVRYCFTCWFWLWWRWNLEFSRWLCTCGNNKSYTHSVRWGG